MTDTTVREVDAHEARRMVEGGPLMSGVRGLAIADENGEPGIVG